MGYYSDFEVYVSECDDSTKEKIFKEISNISRLEYDTNCLTGNEKWYDCIENCKEISSKYPNAIIKVIRFGEDRDDQTVCYFKDYKSACYKIPITIPDLKIDDLK